MRVHTRGTCRTTQRPPAPTAGRRVSSRAAARALVMNPASRGDRLDEPHVAADDRPAADHRLAAEDRRTGIDRDVVLDGGMALAPLARRGPRARLSAPSVTPW